jgi:hypothetical protein
MFAVRALKPGLERRYIMCEDFDGIDWEDWLIIGPLSEEIARERRDRDRLEGENDGEDQDYWDIIDKRW